MFKKNDNNEENPIIHYNYAYLLREFGNYQLSVSVLNMINLENVEEYLQFKIKFLQVELYFLIGDKE